jgi:nucleoside-diphosphate-sugar epimerase
LGLAPLMREPLAGRPAAAEVPRRTWSTEGWVASRPDAESLRRGPMPDRVCLVTGATGFVGLNLVSRLLADGWHVHALTRNRGSRRGRLLSTLEQQAGLGAGRLVIVEGEIGADGCATAVPDRCEVVFHLALLREPLQGPAAAAVARRVAAGGLIEAGWIPETATQHVALNLAGAEEVVAAAAARKVRRIVYCSSWSSYGFQPPGSVVDEYSTPRLASRPLGRSGPVPYCIGKEACEQRMRERCDELGLELAILQPGSIFGPWGEGGWCKLFAKMEADPKIAGMPGSSTFVDARDLAQAFIAAADAGAGAGEAYIIGGTNATNLELQRLVAQLVGASSAAWTAMVSGWL